MEYPSPVSENDVHVTIYLRVYSVYNYSESCSRVAASPVFLGAHVC